MKITNKSTSISTTKRTLYETDTNLSIVEITTDNNKPTYEFYANNPDLHPIFLKKPTAEFYKNYDSFYDYEEKLGVEITNLNDINRKDIDLYYHYNHNLFDKNLKIISTPLIFDWVDTIQERFKDELLFRDIIELLKVHPFVKELKISEIPNHSRDFIGQLGIDKCKVYLPQKDYERIYAIHNNKIRGQIRFGSEFSPKCNIYGKEIDGLLNFYWSDYN